MASTGSQVTFLVSSHQSKTLKQSPSLPKPYSSSAVDVLVSQFIRPNAQQANANRETLDQLIILAGRHAQAINNIDERLEANTQQIAANAEQIAAIGDRLEQFDTPLEETRQLVAQNASGIAQLTVKQDRNAEGIAQLTVKQDRDAEAIGQLQSTQQVNAEGIAQLRADGAGRLQEIEALKELSRTQLAGIIGNGRRIDWLEQQAS